MDNNYKVYRHTFPNGKVYIGITKQSTRQRWNNGIGYDRHPLMSNAITKYGWDNIAHDILFDGLSEEQAKIKEIELISEYKSNDKACGYNMTSGGEGMNGYHHSAESRKKISEAKKGSNNWMHGKTGRLHHLYGKQVSDETRKRQSESHIGLQCGENSPHYGKKHSEERRKKQSEYQTGLMAGENHPLYGKIGVEHPAFGYKHTDEVREKLSESRKGTGNPMYGRPVSNETRKKLSESHKAAWERRKLISKMSDR